MTGEGVMSLWEILIICADKSVVHHSHIFHLQKEVDKEMWDRTVFRENSML